MNGNYGDIVFFALVAVYLAFKLNSVLGKKNEGDDSPREGSSKGMGSFGLNPETVSDVAVEEKAEKIVRLQDFRKEIENFEYSSKKVKESLSTIVEKDRTMSISSVVDGAKYAFDMVLKAFSEADKATLKDLLSAKLYKDFSNKIDDLNKKDLVAEKSLVSITLDKITGAALSGNIAKIKMKFLTEQINLVKDEEGNVVEGDPKHIESIEDEWEFERNIKSSNPNWQIIAV